MGTKTFDGGGETRTVEWAEGAGGAATIREVTRGEVTELVYDADAHETVVTDPDASALGAGGIGRLIDGLGDWWLLADLTDALDRAGVGYKVTRSKTANGNA